jgi:hypothetical protein
MCKQIDKEATKKKILEVAKDNIINKDGFNKLMENDADIRMVALFWGVELVYE